MPFCFRPFAIKINMSLPICRFVTLYCLNMTSKYEILFKIPQRSKRCLHNGPKMACNINSTKTDETQQSHQLYYRGFHSRSSRGKQGSVRKQSKQQHHLIPRKWLPIRFFTILFCSATALYVQATNCCRRQNDRHAWATQWSNHVAESKISKPFFTRSIYVPFLQM